MVKAVCRYIEQHLDEPVTLSRLGSEFHQSPFHLQRSFKAVLGISPRAYADSCRMNQLKRNLQAGHSVTRAMYDAGYSSSSRLYERTASQLGMTPDKYRRGAIAAPIRYTCTDSPLGRMLIAATEKGICTIQFADSDDELEHGLGMSFPSPSGGAMTLPCRPGKRICCARCMATSCAPRCRSTFRRRRSSARCGHTCSPFPSAQPAPTAKSRKPSDSRPRLAPWLAPAPPIRSPWPSPATAWFGRWRHGRLSLGSGTQEKLCWNWNAQREDVHWPQRSW